ncbi:hypothetical protein PAAG_04134 [Paracoccidioides lutzii Pb01]|uniref:Uncharacterized protein n=1 Tax=Paracoccidioides lutzii (strain ATCC MYA-826 / Pb01) TaxID=502779 RepID=C1H040_PARBA|nr:hypothetical protein PAAG_04134 [Paracoccidioides lutzii Pb01]EEH33081.2 hypothetical protein PAAG_04134 [Paracoccidioides lutzii Pb01]
MALQPSQSSWTTPLYTADEDQQPNQAGGGERVKSCGGDTSDSEEDPVRSLFSDDDDDNAADLDSPDPEIVIGLDEAPSFKRQKGYGEERTA